MGRAAGALPDAFPRTEIALLTAKEFLALRNPSGKHHETGSYDFGLDDLNRDYAQRVATVHARTGERLHVEALRAGFRIFTKDRGEAEHTVAVVHDGVVYFHDPRYRASIPAVVHDERGKAVDLGARSFKQVKYLSEVLPLISATAKHNQEKYPLILQRILVHGEPMTVRAEHALRRDRGDTIVIVNGDGLVSASASNEWGATLLSVAREYRGRGLGKILGRFWYDANPSFESGGFTEAGMKNALSMWRDRTREFSARGWYSELVKTGRITKARVREILAEATPVGPAASSMGSPAREKARVDPKDVLVYVDADGVAFAVYNKAFLTNPDEKFIYGYGFFRDAPKVGTFIYAIDYDRPFARFTTAVALQLARDRRERLYVGEGYRDVVEVEGIDGVVKKGDYLEVTRDLLPLKEMTSVERRVRRAADPHGEKGHLLVETAESKWR
jgi:hypothetical protein